MPELVNPNPKRILRDWRLVRRPLWGWWTSSRVDKAVSQSCTSSCVRDGCWVMRSELHSGWVGPLRPDWGRVRHVSLCGAFHTKDAASVLAQGFSFFFFSCLETQIHTCAQTREQTFTHTQTSRGLFPVCLEFSYLTFFFLLGIDTLFLPCTTGGWKPVWESVCVGMCVCTCGFATHVCTVNNSIHLVMVPLKLRVIIHSQIHSLFPDMCVRTAAARQNLCPHFPSVQLCLRGKPPTPFNKSYLHFVIVWLLPSCPGFAV